jgi:hypothetical protein
LWGKGSLRFQETPNSRRARIEKCSRKVKAPQEEEEQAAISLELKGCDVGVAPKVLLQDISRDPT